MCIKSRLTKGNECHEESHHDNVDKGVLEDNPTALPLLLGREQRRSDLF